MSIRNKRIVLLIVCLFFILIAGLIISARSKSGKVQLVFMVAPPQADTFVNGKKVDKTSYQKPGTYKVKVAREGFASYETDVTLTKDKPKTVVPAGLVPQTPAAIKEASKYEKDYKKLEPEASKKVNDAGQALQSKYPIMTSLPYRSSIYSIEYGRTDQQDFIVQVFAKSPATRQVALAKIRDWGYDPADYPIQFVDLKNPFDPDLQVRDH